MGKKKAKTYEIFISTQQTDYTLQDVLEWLEHDFPGVPYTHKVFKRKARFNLTTLDQAFKFKLRWERA